MMITTDVMFTQISDKEGINKFGGQAVAAMFKELKHLNDRSMPEKIVFGTINPDGPTPIKK